MVNRKLGLFLAIQSGREYPFLVDFQGRLRGRLFQGYRANMWLYPFSELVCVACLVFCVKRLNAK